MSCFCLFNAAPLANQERSEQRIQCALRLFGSNRHIVIFQIGIHYVNLLLNGKRCPMALGK